MREWLKKLVTDGGKSKMAVNIIATRIDQKRVALSDTVETNIVLEGTNTLRYLEMQARGGTVRVSFTPGGTLSTDNYNSIDQGTRWLVQDVALRPIAADGVFCYARGEAASVTLEIVWGQ